ncbi:hypothetical protein QZH41_013873 [Actinostola sp. cb2023]|nr:hypothetical protein QZH41_013873 [Actinostola sp. cb2023]
MDILNQYNDVFTGLGLVDREYHIELRNDVYTTGQNCSNGNCAHEVDLLPSSDGIPDELISDNMPYNSKQFKEFAKDWGFTVTTSSPTYV